MRLSFLPAPCLHYRADDFLPYRENQPCFISFSLFISFFFHSFLLCSFSLNKMRRWWYIYIKKIFLFRECLIRQMGKVGARLSWRGDPDGMWNWPFMGSFFNGQPVVAAMVVSHFSMSDYHMLIWASLFSLSVFYCVPSLCFFFYQLQCLDAAGLRRKTRIGKKITTLG